MKLHTAARAPNPRRVDMFIAEKGIEGITRELVDLNAGEHRSDAFTARNPMSRVPVLELDDGRFLAESRAICSYLESLHPEPNLMGTSAEERAFIEMADRQVEFHLVGTIAHFVKGTRTRGCWRSRIRNFRTLARAKASACSRRQGCSTSNLRRDR